MKSILIKGGKVFDPSQNLERVADVLIEAGKIKSVGKAARKASITIDAKGLIVAPGLIDMHVHLREPGNEDEETIASGSAAAVAGGFTSVACMPNTDPPVDNEASAEFVFLQAERARMANIYPIGTITMGREGVDIAEIGQLSRGGVVGFSDDGDTVQNAGVMRIALQYARMFDRPIISHCEDKNLVGSGVMHSGYVSMVLGLPGMPSAGEEIIVNRDITLAETTGAKLHIAHVSTAGSVDLIRRAKKRGVKVTAEVTPHHLALTDECVRSYDPNFKMNPPLRTEKDQKALLKGLKDGTIDVIASDHAPHTVEEKDVEFGLAPFGVIGMESTLGVLFKTLIRKKVLTLSQMIAKLTVGPARVLGIPKGTLRPGADADVTIIDPDLEWTIDASKFKSKSRNCPFHGWKVKGKAVRTIVGGEIRCEE
ncbi:MAG: dihydroorotase [Planctomycetota bacterium]